MSGQRISRLLFLLVLFAVLSLGNVQAKVNASPSQQNICYFDYEWAELEMGSFVLVFPIEETGLAEQIFSNYPDDLESLMSNYSQAFGVELVLPVTIRIYPTQEVYYCLNPLAPTIGENTAHSHIGQREIVIFGNVIQGSLEEWDGDALNGFQHELAILFAEEISEGYAPPGLLKGLGGYAENPQETFGQRFEAAGSSSSPDVGWGALWDGEVPLYLENNLLQTVSTVAYLIDVHGWGKFLELLEQIKIEQGYRQAITGVYGTNLQVLQNHWRGYYPLYVEQRWEANVIHRYDLETFRQLITAGAYADSIPGLVEAVGLLEIFGDEEDIQEAQQLLAQAEKGARAGELTLQSRQALLSGRYVESYTTGKEALKHYEDLGDTRRVAELEVYLAIAKEVLDLRTGLEVIKEEGIGINPFKSQRVFDIGQRLLELGDMEGVGQAERILLLLGAGRNTFFRVMIIVFVLISSGLIVRRIISLRKPRPPEADLL